MIDVLIVEPNKLPYEKKIKNDLKTYQEIVDGMIETTGIIGDREILIVCNDEGKNLNMPYNRDIGHDIIAGTFIIVGNDYENLDFKSLTKEQIAKYKNKFNEKSIKDTEIKIIALAAKSILRNYEI